MVQNEVLAKVPDPLLRVYFVWVPMMESDSFEEARNAAVSVEDRRALHFWDGDLRLARRLGSRLGLPPSKQSAGAPGLAWDVYLVYGASERWRSGEDPTAPRKWQHQLDAVPPEMAPALDGPALRAAVSAALRGD